MKLYIILTYDIHGVGGTQTYTWGKCEYLDRTGWDTAVFFPGDNTGNSSYGYLNKYICGGLNYLSDDPAKLDMATIKYLAKKSLKRYSYKADDYKEIIIESHYNDVALWGETFAKVWGCKHICFICNEYFQPPRKYWDHLEFYKFKYDRNELYGIHKLSMSRLFNHKYDDIPEKEDLVFHAFYPGNVVQDIWDVRMNCLIKADWNMVYFGRSSKGYFSYVLKNIAQFAEDHDERSIQFILISDAESKNDYIKYVFKNCSNVTIRIMGSMSPVPSKILTDADVVIAGAGCARWSFISGAYTLVLDAKETTKANGFLGYDTFNTLFAEDIKIQESVYYYLDQLLIKGKYEKRQREELYHQPIISSGEIDHRYDEHFELITRSKKEPYYYNLCNPSARFLHRCKDQLKIRMKNNDYIFRLYRIVAKFINQRH